MQLADGMWAFCGCECEGRKRTCVERENIYKYKYIYIYIYWIDKRLLFKRKLYCHDWTKIDTEICQQTETMYSEVLKAPEYTMTEK